MDEIIVYYDRWAEMITHTEPLGFDKYFKHIEGTSMFLLPCFQDFATGHVIRVILEFDDGGYHFPY